MKQQLQFYWQRYREVIFQVLLHVVVFLFYSFDKNQPQIEMARIVLFLNYAAAAFLINYFWLPLFYYKKKYIHFLIALIVTIGVTIFAEECIIEPIYFTGKRADTFPGLFFTLVGILPVICVLSGFKFAWDALGKQRELDELKVAVRESELQFLKSQINPHFLFNNLNNLYAYAIENSPKTPEIILELSGVLRYMLYECKEEYVPLVKEVKQLENFIQLSQLQIEDRGQVTFTTKNIQSTYQIAPLILVVFIENAFKHSMASQVEEIVIQIEVELLEQGRLRFFCKNSFQTLGNNDNLSQGIGLANVKKRLDLLYPAAHSLTIKESENWFEVELNIDLNKNA